ncbi:MAG: hypothetical protein KAU01_11595 [Candidatus Cloacimonetes bacterium]|nr:hypothetical protein [Candidatus Cloacimonadota bacterium]
MKIVYLFTHDIVKHAGVTKKVLSQTQAWKNLGNKVKICNISLKKKQIPLSSFSKKDVYFRESIFYGAKFLFKDISEFKPDIIYFRFEPYKPYVGKILKKYKTIAELNTDDYSEMRLNAKKSLIRKIRFLYYLITRNKIYKNIDGFVTVTDEIANLPHILKWEKPSISIPNSINIIKYPILKKKSKSKIPHVLFIGTPNHPWHGIDKILDLAIRTENKLFFHIVGMDKRNYLTLSNVKFYGHLTKDKYQEIVTLCQIGIGSLAFHRLGINEACPLKIREYLTYGLPIIIGYSDTAFVTSKLPEWVLELPNESNNISNNVDLILKFCKKMKNRIIHHDEIKNYIDSNILERKKLVFFKKIIDG